jgi:PPK2 family polyphosphate:nucleotide phosphotransferase
MKELISRLDNLEKDPVKKATKEMLKEIGDLQYQMYAQKKHSLLIILQGLDASGKDGLVRDLLEYCNPIGLNVTSFKKPTPEEYAHDFLWRVHRHTPAKGMIQIFIRSQYEDILVPSVEGYIPAEVIGQRYAMINQFEEMVRHNGTTILKFYMSVSREKQEERLNERITNPEKHWKHNDGDWDTLQKRERYMEVYQRIFKECSGVPWEVIPADSNWQKIWAAANILLKTLRQMKLEWPGLESERFGK